MKTLVTTAAAVGALLFIPDLGVARPAPATSIRFTAPELNAVVKQYCQGCHSDRLKRGNLTLASFDVARPHESADVAEKVIGKLRTGMMPPPGSKRPSADTVAALIDALETQLDSAAMAHPDPGYRTFQRLNRPEYEAAIRDLLTLKVDASAYLPPDTKSENFDNIADVQTLSPMLLEGYLRAASDISWMAVGNPRATSAAATLTVPRTASQVDHVEGAPYGTRGGVSEVHVFPADGLYAFTLNFFHETTGAYAGGLVRGEAIEVSIDGERVALVHIDRHMHASDPNGVSMATDPVKVTAGPHRVSAAFIPPAFQGVVQDLISPLKWSLNSTSNATAYGFTLLPHLRDLVINGPVQTTGVSETPVRRHIFTCKPSSATATRPCARTILTRLATQAYRRPVVEKDIAALLALYDDGARNGGFENGVRNALEGILASPDFYFRFERAPATAKAGSAWKLRDVDLASRLAFFLWASPPDRELVTVAAAGRLSNPVVLERQVKRMLADPRAEALATRFAAQWLRLPDLAMVQPDVRQYPDFDEQLRDAMRKETELFFKSLVDEDKSAMELYTADYTYMNGRLAEHYGMPGVAGNEWRKVKYTDSRRGVLGHSSVLTLTSHATRTSAVERGKWVMEVLLNSPPPPPPPGVPDLEATPGNDGARILTVRERMEQHRKNPACSSCHKMMDPIGVALENYDATGRWRARDNGTPVDPRGELWDGSQAQSLSDLSTALTKRKEVLLRTFTRNLMAYAVGRRVEAHDMPTIRGIVRAAEQKDHKMSAYIMGIINSPAFRMQRSEPVADAKVTSP
ncbi:MAG: DUF1592 domain-containing protein [Gemmatimonadetes bacterium]|nr:DUF1592 domain-containing protein [Gemmatimonadota bacterium]